MNRRIVLLGALLLTAGCLFKGPDFFSIVGIDEGIPPTAQQIGANSFRLDGTIQGTDQCGFGTISNPGPIVIRVEVIDGVTFLVIESDAEVVGAYVIGQTWTGTGEFTFTSDGTTFTLRETTMGLWQFSGGTIVLVGTLRFEIFSGGSKVCESLYNAIFEQLLPSSVRFKLDVRPLLPAGASPLGLRPVAFRYRAPWGDPAVPRVGLVAEDVARVFPAAVGFDAGGEPAGVYRLTLRRLVFEELEARAARVAEAGIARLARVF